MLKTLAISLFVPVLVVFTACQTSSAPLSSVTTTPGPQPSSAPDIRIQDYVTDLDIPWEMAFAPDGRIFLTERPGKILIISGGQVQLNPWMTLDVAAEGEGGLLGLALDPDFTQNHYIYVAYTYRDGAGNFKNKLVRLQDEPSSHKGVMDKTILDDAGGGGIHDGGRVKFGPDQKIYWTLGETGNGQLAQDLSSLNGKILRLNPDGTIPSDNPFPGSPVYSYGNRNAEGLAWQPGTDRLYATEHGPSGGTSGAGEDEVNYIEPGQNYGWPVIHGDQTRQGMINPIMNSGTVTWAPSGATFVSGGPWNGSFLFTGLRGESLYRLTLDKTDPRKVLTFDRYFSGQHGRLRDVVQGPDGALYILTSNTDGRGSPEPGDDRILKLIVK